MNRRAAIAATVALAIHAVGLPTPAQADATPQALALCQNAPRGCALEARGVLREGTTSEVTVIGTPHVRVQVMVYNAVVTDGELTALEPMSNPTEVFTNSDGVAHTQVTIPAIREGISSGWALLSVGGVEGTDTSLTVGRFMPFASRIPTVLGDGWASGAKPVGEVLELHFVGAVPGSTFTVEHLDEAGTWQEVSLGAATVSPLPDEVSRIDYTVPRGLVATAHKFRLRNTSDSATAPLWLGTPALEGEPEERMPVFVPPAVGDALHGTQLLNAHPLSLVSTLGWWVGGGAVAATGLLCAAWWLRRPRWGRP